MTAEDRATLSDLPARAAVTQIATYFQPLPAAAQQIADTVISGLGSTAPAAPGAAAVDRPAQRTEPLRVLEIALKPAELGIVSVRMQLTGGTLSLRVSAERPETADLLDGDRDRLAKILHASGFRVETVTIQLGDTTASAGASQQSPGQQAGSHGQAQSSPQGYPGEGRPPQSRAQDQDHDTFPEGGYETAGKFGPDDDGSSALYV